MKNKIITTISLLLFILISLDSQAGVEEVIFKIQETPSEYLEVNTGKSGNYDKNFHNRALGLTSRLLFNETGSKFELIEQLLDEDQEIDVVMLLRLDGIHFNNLSQKKFGEQNQYSDKVINIIDTFQIYWTIDDKKSRTILGYDCKFAEGYYYVYSDRLKKNRKFKCAAWFAPEIPVSYGPREFHGLPGLILSSRITRRLEMVAISMEIKKSETGVDFSFLEKGRDMTRDELNRSF